MKNNKIRTKAGAVPRRGRCWTAPGQGFPPPPASSPGTPTRPRTWGTGTVLLQSSKTLGFGLLVFCLVDGLGFFVWFGVTGLVFGLFSNYYFLVSIRTKRRWASRAGRGVSAGPSGVPGCVSFPQNDPRSPLHGGLPRCCAAAPAARCAPG